MLSSKSREKKKLDQKDQKKLLQGIEPESGVYHLQIRSIYGHIRSEISNTVPDIRRTEDWRVYGHTVWANPNYTPCVSGSRTHALAHSE